MKEKANPYSQPRQRMDGGERERPVVGQDHKEPREGWSQACCCVKAAVSHVSSLPQVEDPRHNDQEFSQGVNNSKKELSQNWECLTAHTIWVKPLHPEVSQDPHTGPQERCSCPSSTATGAAGEAGDLHSASPAPQVPWTPSWQLLLWLELLRKRRTMSLSLLQRQQFPKSLMSR